MSELSIQKQQRLSPKEYRRLSELGYKTQDIKDLGITKVREIIKSGTVKEGETDQAIARREAKDLQIKNRAIIKKDANQTHVTNWLAKLNKQGIKVSEETLREAIASGDVQTFLGNKGISAGGGDTTIPWGVIRSMENVINYENKYEKKEKEVSPKKPYKYEFTYNKNIKEQQEIDKVNTTIKQQDIQLQNRSNLTIPMSPGNKDHMPITNNNNKELSIVK